MLLLIAKTELPCHNQYLHEQCTHVQKSALVCLSDSSDPRRSAQHTLPSSVTAAKTVAECGDQAASPTGLFKSNDMTGRGLSPSHSFSVQSADADRKMRVWMLFHLTAYTVISCPACSQAL